VGWPFGWRQTKLQARCFDRVRYKAAKTMASNTDASMSKQKHAAVAEIDPLRDAGILQHIFEFLPGCWLFLGAVCREWEAVYASMPY
jgi:hypothetical protein